ncbi:hypothetical protein P154DRAFT_609595 [Amniculicola lignicola CBS 123094]|uniref:Uncharacterized protein n=1 Tax=Amniculicola lignicola CBS 123094 TaxID=1392246 RepID=A0A6A5WEI8_9PLEO|nr:hypothetical protein P154DRAFT_609595 [Amniculicola lignicola CBS 123094]
MPPSPNKRAMSLGPPPPSPPSLESFESSPESPTQSVQQIIVQTRWNVKKRESDGLQPNKRKLYEMRADKQKLKRGLVELMNLRDTPEVLSETALTSDVEPDKEQLEAGLAELEEHCKKSMKESEAHEDGTPVSEMKESETASQSLEFLTWLWKMETRMAKLTGHAYTVEFEESRTSERHPKKTIYMESGSIVMEKRKREGDEKAGGSANDDSSAKKKLKKMRKAHGSRLVVCRNCYLKSKPCDTVAPCVQCKAEGTSCLRTKCKTFHLGGSACVRPGCPLAHPDDGYVNLRNSGSRGK